MMYVLIIYFVHAKFDFYTCNESLLVLTLSLEQIMGKFSKRMSSIRFGLFLFEFFRSALLCFKNIRDN